MRQGRPALPQPGLRSLFALVMLVLNAPEPKLEMAPAALAGAPAVGEAACGMRDPDAPAQRPTPSVVLADPQKAARRPALPIEDDMSRCGHDR